MTRPLIKEGPRAARNESSSDRAFLLPSSLYGRSAPGMRDAYLTVCFVCFSTPRLCLIPLLRACRCRDGQSGASRWCFDNA
jgi:hypothetical protein